MTLLLFLAIYASAACFLSGCILRVRQYATLPAHLRWELYPVPHEARERVAHGGSYFEESEWWTKPRRFHLAGELRVMAEEIFLFKSLWQNNRNLWWRSFSFHFGMYSVLAALALSFTGLLPMVARGVGLCGLTMIAFGGLALLLRRATSSESHDYTHIADYIHLAAIAAISATVFMGCHAANAPSVRTFAHALFTGNTKLVVPRTLSAGVLMAAALLAYVPYSHMAHFIAKYFTFHEVRWDDARMEPGSSLEAKMRTNLARKPTWYALHLGADGKKSWAEIASTNPTSPEVRS